VTSLAELIEAVELARHYHAPLFILGGGANLLVSDAGMRGLVLENRAGRIHFPPLDSGEGPATILVESGVALPNLARRCARRGLSGLEWAVGVPGTVGGAIVNNAGAYGSDMAGTLIRAELLSLAGERLWQPASWFNYDYRTSRLKGQKGAWVVLQAELALSVRQPGEVEAKMNLFNERRKSSQPPGATMGSMFKNPPGDYAGRLIEAAGLKGFQAGQAQISPVHANFFKNLGQATATEMMSLIKTAQSAVAARFGVALELEIEVVGEFPEKA
jgi:UDP-N-acetylmuramate dehydrogenase